MAQAALSGVLKNLHRTLLAQRFPSMLALLVMGSLL